MKITKTLFAAGAVLALASCSNDDTPEFGNASLAGSTAYLAVNIQDAGSALTRANDGGYEFGSADEHAVNSAHFYFFDANGIYVTEASVWTGGVNGPADQDNIEYMGKNVLVLKGLKSDRFPEYMLTVLNSPAGLNPIEDRTTLEEMASQVLGGVYSGSGENKNFYMSTTSFFGDGKEGFEGYDNKYYYANKLRPTDFFIAQEGVENVNPATLGAVNVYVERLAAKLTVQGIGSDYYPVTVTVAGNSNDNINGDNSLGIGATELYVKFNDWDVNGVEKGSYLSKQLDGMASVGTTPVSPWSTWNDAPRFRSYWGHSVSYGKDADLTHLTWNQVNGGFANALYIPEHTNTAAKIADGANLLKSKVTEVIFSATVYEKVGNEYKPLDMVLYNGVYYRRAHYINYAFNSLNKSGLLNFYVKSEKDGKVVFNQISADNVVLQTRKGDGTGSVQLVSTFGLGDKLYALSTDGAAKNPSDRKESDFSETSVSALNANLAAFNVNARAEAFADGKMYYTVPVEHLLKKNGDIVEGNYGVVRNHWYNIEIGKVLNLGHGVFNPDTEEIIPDDNDTKSNYALAARINILSWKIVSQKVDL